MIIKKNFELLRGTSNYLDLSPQVISHLSIENGPRKIFVVLELVKSNIQHFTKDKVYDFISDINVRKKLHVIKLPSYLLPIAYNQKTDGIILNLSAFGVDDIYPTNPGALNIYACLVYGLTLNAYLSGNKTIDIKYFKLIADYLTSIFMRVFGKIYGLLGSFSVKIPLLKFLISSYVLESFFGLTGIENYRKASSVSAYDFRQMDTTQLQLNSILGLIQALSDLKVMPGMNRYIFSSKIMRMFSFHFIPALEDISRFISIIATSNIKGSSVVPTFINKYNETNYNLIVDLTKKIF